MTIFTRWTKRLFGQKDLANETPAIIDGEVINTPKRINVHTPKHTNSDTHNAETTAEAATVTDENVEKKIDKRKRKSRQPFGFPGSSVPEQYFIFLGSAGRAARTIQEYAWELNWWEQQCKPLPEISLALIEATINTMHPATARRKIAALRSYAKWMLRNGEDRLFITLSQVVLPRIPIRVPRDKGKDFFKEMSRRAIDITKEGDRRGIWLGLMLCCGLRISEIQTARAAPDGAIKVLGKGNKERLVPAPEWLRSAIKNNQMDGKSWAKDRKLIWAEMKKMNIKRPHSLRHTYASELVRNDLELEQVKALLGHAKLDTTLIYARTKLPENLMQKLGVDY
jgi:integrase/recombinase XerD